MKRRAPTIRPALRDWSLGGPLERKTWRYIVGIARTNKFKALAVGGMRDHARVLMSLPTTMSVAKAVQSLKGGSSKWINDHLPDRSFDWQDGDGAFTMGISQLQTTVRYIDNQERHHSRMTFEEELIRMLKKHGLQLYRDQRD